MIYLLRVISILAVAFIAYETGRRGADQETPLLTAVLLVLGMAITTLVAGILSLWNWQR